MKTRRASRNGVRYRPGSTLAQTCRRSSSNRPSVSNSPRFPPSCSCGVPVEWLEYPNEGHVKAGAANKWWVHQRNLDWFRFWLQDYADPAPRKTEQYARWRELRQRSVQFTVSP